MNPRIAPLAFPPLIESRSILARSEPTFHTNLFHGRGKGLIKCTVICNIELLMSKLMKYQSHQLRLRPVDNSTGEWIIEPAQG